MELTGEVRIAAPRERVWHALNDARTLMACIPGCEEVEISSPTERHVRLLVKAGPVRARFVGKITLSDVLDGSACVMNFEGVVHYTATASVGGKLGQIGARMLDAASKQMADQFFKRLSQELGDGPAAASANAAATAPAALAAVAEPTSGTTTHPTRTSASHTAPAPTPATALLSEGTRVLWFACGCAATGFGVWLASLLR